MFTMRAKLPEPRRDVSPSPSHYNPNTDFGKDSAHISIAGKPKEKSIENIPGPGNYNPD